MEWFEARRVLAAIADWEVGDTESEQQKICPQGGLGLEACATGIVPPRPTGSAVHGHA
jgi:hypothetical protein